MKFECKKAEYGAILARDEDNDVIYRAKHCTRGLLCDDLDGRLHEYHQAVIICTYD